MFAEFAHPNSHKHEFEVTNLHVAEGDDEFEVTANTATNQVTNATTSEVQTQRKQPKILLTSSQISSEKQSPLNAAPNKTSLSDKISIEADATLDIALVRDWQFDVHAYSFFSLKNIAVRLLME